MLKRKILCSAEYNNQIILGTNGSIGFWKWTS